MNNKDLKQLRGQIRIIVKELLPEIVAIELIQALEKKLGEEMRARLDAIDDRQKSLQAYMVRQSPKIEPKKA
jgi:hypothetical protein